MLKFKINMIALAMTVSFVASAADVPANVKLAETQELVRGNGTEVPTLDPTLSSDTSSSRVIRDMFDGLVSEDQHGNVIPALATRWEVDKTGTVYTFYIRKDAFWSNDAPILASDFEYSFKREVDPKSAAPYAWYMALGHIKNAAAVSDGSKSVDELGVKAIDDKTLQITLDQPVAYFVKMLGNTATFPVYRGAIEKYGDKWTKPENIVVSGAYKPAQWILNERLDLERNAKYWNNDKTVINKVTYLPIEDAMAEYNRYRTGEIDITADFPLEQYRNIKQERPDELLTMPSLGVYYYLFNLEKAPFNDVRVRKALAYAIDRNIVTDRILGQGQIPAYGIVPPSVAGYQIPQIAWGQMTQDARNQKAKELLKEAGFGPENPLNIELDYNTSESHKKLALVVSSMWKKNLGVSVTLENQEWKSFLKRIEEKDFGVARYAWIGDYNEPSTFLSYFQSDGMNYGGWSSEKFDGLLANAISSSSDDVRNDYYQKAEQTFIQDMPAIPLYYYTASVLKQKNVGGYSTDNASDVRMTKDMYIIK
ncbi:peptide ABC transporter substrate-binding protein [Vibrio sp. Vb339]|uniref:peptide ABC transporter substrate-binding protein n=1 Tax=Vibrio sp. Vb339 TaxID=1192013 RepID=UPI001554DA56|nr:peptide ABC transporter substrate-binding protein [Vibrio sp. Vb339]